MSFLAELLAELILTLILWVILWPVVMILAAPVIFIRALFIDGSFPDNVSDGYTNVSAFWDKMLDKL